MCEQFKSKGGSKLKEYCVYGTKRDCMREMAAKKACDKVRVCQPTIAAAAAAVAVRLLH